MILDKLAQIKTDDYKDDQMSMDIITEWKDKVPLLIAKSEFKNHPITMQIAELTRKEIQRIKNILSDKEDITELERKTLFAEKKAHEFYLSLFTYDPGPELEVIEKQIEEEVGESE